MYGIFLFWFVILIVRIVKRPVVASQQSVDRNEFYSLFKTSSKALYKSKDNGIIWEYVNEVNKE